MTARILTDKVMIGILIVLSVFGVLMAIDAADADQGITRIVIIDEKNLFGSAKMYFYQYDPTALNGTNRFIYTQNFGDNITLANGISYRVVIREDTITSGVDRVLGMDTPTLFNIILVVAVFLLGAALVYYMRKK